MTGRMYIRRVTVYTGGPYLSKSQAERRRRAKARREGWESDRRMNREQAEKERLAAQLRRGGFTVGFVGTREAQP